MLVLSALEAASIGICTKSVLNQNNSVILLVLEQYHLGAKLALN